MVKELGEEFEGQFVCLGENTKKHIIFFAKIKKENENGKTITYKKIIESIRYIMSGW